MFRQGDVLLIKVSALPEGKSKKVNGLVLAYGEATGHSHTVVAEKINTAVLLEYADMKFGTIERYLELKGKATLRHEEHAAIDLDPGIYKVVQQREYSPEEIRNIID